MQAAAKHKHDQHTCFYRHGGLFGNHSKACTGYKHGKQTWFHINGVVSCVGAYILGKETGDWVWYNDKGKIILKGTYENDFPSPF